MKRRISYFFISLISLICLCYAQEQSTYDMRLRFHLINVSSGLSNNFVNDIVQDSLGFIWISTFDGLNRYDGTNFVQFKEQINATKKGLSNNFVKELKLINQSQILIATDEGLDIYDFKSESFRVINSNHGLINNSVSAIGFTQENQVILSTYHGGIQIIDKNWELQTPSYLAELPSNEISSIAIQNDSTLWIGTYDRGLTKINLASKEVTVIPFGENTNFPSAVINKLYTDSKGNLWVGSRGGLQVIAPQGSILTVSRSSSANSGLSDNDILCFSEDGLGNMWIGTRNGGLNILDINSLFYPDEKLNIKWFLPRTDGLSVYNRTVSALMRDYDNNMWIGTPTGINYVNPRGEIIELIQRNLASNSISHDRIGALTKSKNNKIWIGTDGNGLDLFDAKKGVIKHYEHKPNDRNSLSNNYIISLLEDSKGSLWVGTYRGGLHKILPKSNSFKHYLEGSPSEGSDVRVIFESKNKDIWVGTNRGGLYKYNAIEDSFKYIKALGKIDIRDIDQDKGGNLWMATYGSGIIKYNHHDESFTIFDQQNTPELTSNVIFSIMVLDDNTILSGTRYGGLIRMDLTNNSLKNFTKQDGLSNNTICSFIAEDSTYVWMGTYNGISRYNLHTDEIINLTILNNIQNGEFNIGAIAKDDSGLLFLGGNNGLNIIKSSEINESRVNPTLIYNELRVLNNVIRASDSTSAIIDQAILFKDKITLKHNQNTFSLGFMALKYPEAKNVSYSYKLENYNDFWIDNQDVGLANFTNVPPGDYTLKVKMNTGFNQSNPSELKISILPPFWKTWYAYLLYALATALIVWLVLKDYSQRIHLKNSLLFEKKQRQLEHELNEERFRFITAFSHELKTSLTLVVAPIEYLITRERSEELKSRLIFIRKNGKKLFQSINQLIEFRKSEEGLSKLNISRHNLPYQMKKWLDNYQPLANNKNITLTHCIGKRDVWFLIDLEKIEIIFNNLLSNAIKYCKREGNVHVDFSYNQHGFSIKVTDTGIGIIKEELQNIFNWYYRSNSTLKKNGTGIGLALSKRFVELHDGTICVRSIPGEKTEIVVEIPITHQEDTSKSNIEKKNQQEETIIKVSPSKPELLTEIPTDTDSNRPLILIIDDNPDMLYFLNDICKQEFDVILAVDGVEGIQKASIHIPNLIVSDIMMPEKDGIDLCRHLRMQHSTSHIPIILLTAKGNIESIALGFDEGAEAYITKPFNPQLLITRIKNLLNSRIRLQKHFLNKGEVTLTDVSHQEGHVLDTQRKFLVVLDATIKKHIASDSDKVDNIAKDIGMSRTSLYRKLKAISGMSINEYIRNLKIELAVELIQEKKLSISQASYQVGFSNIKYFRKVFKEKYGKNPSEFKA